MRKWLIKTVALITAASMTSSAVIYSEESGEPVTPVDLFDSIITDETDLNLAGYEQFDETLTESLDISETERFDEPYSLIGSVESAVNAVGADFNVYRYIADNILEDGSHACNALTTYMNNIETIAETWRNSMTPQFEGAVKLWEEETLILNIGSLMDNAIEARGYYMTVLMSMFESSYESDNLLNQLANQNVKKVSKVWSSFANFFETVSNQDIEIFLSKKEYTEDEIALLHDSQKRFLENNNFVQGAEVLSDIMDMIKLAKTPYEYVEKMVEYCDIYNMSEDWKDTLQKMYNKTAKDNSPLCQALEALLEASQSLDGAVWQVWKDGFSKIGSEFYSVAVKELMKELANACPLLKGINLGTAIGTSLSNLLFGTDKTKEKFYIIKAYCECFNLLKSVYKDTINTYTKNRTVDNAIKFINVTGLYFTAMNAGNELGQDFTDVLFTGGIINYIFRSRKQYEQYKKISDDLIKETESTYKFITHNWLLSLYDEDIDMYEALADLVNKDDLNYIPVSRIEFEQDSAEWGLHDCDHRGYVCTVYPDNATYKGVTYKSSDPSIASISRNGILTLNKVGTCTITAISEDFDDITDTLEVTIVDTGAADSTVLELIDPIDQIGSEFPDDPANPDIPDTPINASPVVDSGSCGRGVRWSLNEEGTLTISGVGDMKDYENNKYNAPPSIWRKNAKKIVIKSGVTSIGNYAFHSCGITNIEIPDSITSIGGSAFQSCSSLTNIAIPNSVKSIGSQAFYNCSSLTSITIPGSVTSIGGSAFSGCSSLTSITIPEGVTSIGDYAFDGCSSLTSVIVQDGITSIGEGTFRNCSSLIKITLPNTLTTIGSGNYYGDDMWGNSGAFYHCTSLTNIVIPNSVASIGDCAFDGCSSLTSIDIPSSVTHIGHHAFSGCSSLARAALPNSIMYIGSYAFNNCNSLASIIIPDSLTSIENDTFRGCSSLARVEIPNSVISIDKEAFKYCQSLESIKIPNSMTAISESAFAYCYSLKNIEISNNVTSIGTKAFYACSKLERLVIPSGVKSIGIEAFESCKALTDIEISDTITSIGNSAFNECSSIKDVYYTGSESQWNNIVIGTENNTLKNANIHFNSTIPPIQEIIGDLDNDGVVTTNDALFVLQASFSSTELTEEQFAIADVDGDGILTTNDTFLIIKSSFENS